jgi:hypothetical protein
LAAATRSEPRLTRRVWYVKIGDEGLALVLRDRLELRLGNATELALKLRVAKHVLAAVRGTGSPATYVDVAVPDRPVVGTTLDSQVEP